MRWIPLKSGLVLVTLMCCMGAAATIRRFVLENRTIDNILWKPIFLNKKILFGGGGNGREGMGGWTRIPWETVDDRVRGGKSTSELIVHDNMYFAVFKGHLDIKTLGGAGFASQRTCPMDDEGNPVEFDLSSFKGLMIKVALPNKHQTAMSSSSGHSSSDKYSPNDKPVPGLRIQSNDGSSTNTMAINLKNNNITSASSISNSSGENTIVRPDTTFSYLNTAQVYTQNINEETDKTVKTFSINLQTREHENRGNGRFASKVSYKYSFTVNPIDKHHHQSQPTVISSVAASDDNNSNTYNNTTTTSLQIQGQKLHPLQSLKETTNSPANSIYQEFKIYWHEFEKTYRGRPDPNSPELDPAEIKCISIMCQSYFGKQEGDFELKIYEISSFS